MFSHIMIGTNDLDKAKSFYDALLGTLGVKPGHVDRHRIFWRTKTGTFSTSKPIDGKVATFANGGTIGFAATSPAAGGGRCLPCRRPRAWRQDLRGSAGHPRRRGHEALYRLFARSRRQQDLRPAPGAGMKAAPHSGHAVRRLPDQARFFDLSPRVPAPV